MAGTRDPVGEVGQEWPGPSSGSIPTLEHLEGQQIGRYLIRQRLGGGGVATVYQAYDQVMGQTVALKLLPPNPDDATLSRFRREALMAGALRHPHIVRIYQVGASARGGVAYMAMELVEGESLAGLLARQGSLQPAESCNLLEPVAQALAFAHQHGIVHRDVKPGNVLLRPVSPNTPYSVQLEALDYPVIPLLSDFGVARFLDAPELTSTGRTVGTPAFMAPEQCMGSREIDGRADIYALGTVLFRCVSGRLPFSGSMTQVLHAQVYEPVVIEDDLLRRLGPVATILQRSLAKDPEDRYPDAATLAGDLAQAARRTRGNQSGPSERISATATLTLATLDAVAAPEPAKSVTVLVAGSAAAATALPPAPKPTQSDQARRPRSYARWAGVAVILVLASALGAFGLWARAWRDSQARQVPATPQLAVLAPGAPTQALDGNTATPETMPEGLSAGSQAAGVVTQPIALEAVTPGAGAAEASVSVPLQATATPTSLPPTPQPAAGASPTPVLAPTATPAAVVTATVQIPPLVESGQPLTATQGDAIAGVCANVVDEFFMRTSSQLDAAVRGEFRCPTGPAYAASGSLLRFSQGFMLHLDESPFVYVYYQASGEWEQVVKRAEAGLDGEPSGGPPPPFAQVWSEEQRRIALGAMSSTAPSQIDGLVQVFTGGLLVGDRATGSVYAFPLNRLRL